MNNSFSLTYLWYGILKKIPFPFIQIFLDYSLDKMYNKYPRIFSKVAKKDMVTFLIVPIDLPFNFFMEIRENSGKLSVIEKEEKPIADATIKATLNNLLRLFEGKIDGDAAFFSKNLIIEGSTAAIVALRNALDSESINIINDLTEPLGIFKKFVRKLIIIGISKYNSVNSMIDKFKEELFLECNKKINNQTLEIINLKTIINELQSTLLKK